MSCPCTIMFLQSCFKTIISVIAIFQCYIVCLGFVCFRNSGVNPRLLDEEELQRQLEERQHQIVAYRMYREEVEKMRIQERIERNLLKKKQLELCEQMQVWERTYRQICQQTG